MQSDLGAATAEAAEARKNVKIIEAVKKRLNM
jgi:hypothetical protein